MALTCPKLRVLEADRLHPLTLTRAAVCKVPGEYKKGVGLGDPAQVWRFRKGFLGEVITELDIRTHWAKSRGGCPRQTRRGVFPIRKTFICE